MPSVIRWTGSGEYEFDVAGESFYQANLKAIAGDERRKKVVAQLVCERNNKHDPNAVKVEINGALVGHLPRQLALAHRLKLQAQKQKWAIVECEAVVATGRDGAIGVYLDLPFNEDEVDDLKYGAATQSPRAARPFVRRHYTLLWVIAIICLISVGASPIGLALAIFLIYYRLKRW
jgi:hypothetical protein